MEQGTPPPHDAVKRFKEAFAIYTNPGVQGPPAPAKKTIASVLTIVSQSKLVKARPKRSVNPEETKGKGWIACLKFVLFLLLFMAPLVALQIAAREEREVGDWVLLTGYLYFCAIGIGMLVSSLLQGFRYFFLVFLLPFCALAVLLRHPIVGAIFFLCTQIYAMYFIFVRMRSLAFKALVFAFIVATTVTGPLLIGNASFVGAIYEKSRGLLEKALTPSGMEETDKPAK